MADERYLIGLDYGTESARGILLGAESGEVLAVHRHAYRHGVMAERLPSEWALQNPDDYLEAAEVILKNLAEQAQARGGEVAGIGVDFTASTVLPTRSDGTPLSRAYPDEPHAYAKLWKHHAAQPWADRISHQGGDYLRYTGGKTSCEWLPAKAAQLREEAPAIWDETERFIEAGDWLVSQLVGREVRSICQAGYKAHFRDGLGYPEELDALVPGLAGRLAPPVAVGEAAGPLTGAWAERTGLRSAPVVAVATIDAHAVVPAVGVARPGALVATLGTSACHLLLAEECRFVPGVAGVVRDGVLPHYWGYEAGQAGFGDILAWFVRSFPAGADAAASFAHYDAGAAALAPGASGVLALDWWSGCRTPVMNPELSGVFVGMTLQTTPTDLYRALLESLCFGTRRIVDTFEEGGVPVNELVVTSGLVEKKPYMAQLMADVTGRPVRLPVATEVTARGAAIHAAVAAGVVADFEEGAAKLGATRSQTLEPDSKALSVYGELYRLYLELAQRMADLDTMPALRRLREQADKP